MRFFLSPLSIFYQSLHVQCLGVAPKCPQSADQRGLKLVRASRQAQRDKYAREELPDLRSRLALTALEVARALGVSERHVRSMPELPRVHVGNRVLFPVDALRAWLNRRVEEECRATDRVVRELLEDR